MNNRTISRRDFLKLAGVGAGTLLVSCLPASGPDREPVAGTSSPQPPALTRVPPSPVPVDGVVVLADGLNFPEGPAFAPDGSLWCTEMLAGNLIRWTADGVQRIPTDGKPNGLAIDYQGRAWICDSSLMAVRRYDPANGQWDYLSMAVEGHFLQAPNDLCFDAQGNLLFTCPDFDDEQPNGYVCCLKPDGTTTKIVTGMYRPNGLDVVDNGLSLVVGDTFQQKLYKGRWDAETGAVSDFQPWSDVGGSTGPDGMYPGADGLLYVAIYGDGVVKAVNAAGEIAGIYSLPGLNPTNVAVDPSGRLGLVVTEAEKGLLLSLPYVQPGVSIFDGQAAA